MEVFRGCVKIAVTMIPHITGTLLPSLSDYKEFHETMLNVAGVMLGLAFSALLFILSGGFKDFPTMRRTFLRLYASLGGNLLASLGMITAVAFAALYFPQTPVLQTLAVYSGLLIWSKTLLDYNRQLGYIRTLFSTKFVPRRYGPFQAYFRYIRNLGIFRNSILLVQLGIFAVYPLAANRIETGSYGVTSQCVYLLVGLHFGYALLRIIGFVPQFFMLTETEHLQADGIDDLNGDKPGSKSGTDYRKECELLRKHLLDHGFSELGHQGAEFLEGIIRLNLLPGDDRKDAWFNVHLDIPHQRPQIIRDACLSYAQRLFVEFCRSGCDVEEVVASFHFEIDGESQRDAIFLRTNRTELEKLLPPYETDPGALLRVKSKLVQGIYKSG